MYNIFILTPSSDLCEELTQILSNQFHVSACTDSASAVEILTHFSPDIMLLNLSYCKNAGSQFLEQLACATSSLIIGLLDTTSASSFQEAASLRVDFLIRIPSAPEFIEYNVSALANRFCAPSPEKAYSHLLDVLSRLGIRSSWKGCKLITEGLPVFSQDTDQSLNSELYPYLVKKCNYSSVEAVEGAIRNAISRGWSTGDRSYWNILFPGYKESPPNKEVLTVMARLWNSFMSGNYSEK